MLSRLSLIVGIAALLGFVALPAHAQVTQYSNRASFEAVVSSLALIDFNDQVPNDLFTAYGGGSITLSGVTFTPNAALYAVSPNFYDPYNLGDGPVLSFQEGAPSLLTISLLPGTHSVGMDFGSFAGSDATFTLSTGDSFTLSSSVGPDSTPTFAGFVSAEPISFITVSMADTAPMIDRFVSSGSTAAPEPGSLALLGMAALPVVGMIRRRKA